MPAFDAIGMDAIGASSAQSAGQNATASGATLTGAATITGGAASAAAAGTAPGATLTGAGTITGGAASGTKSASAPGATLTGSGAIQGGAASNGSQPATITVPTSRTATFAARPRVFAFTGSAPVSVAKVSADQLYFIGDFTKDLTDGGTTAESVAPVSVGLTVLEGPTLQGALGVVKIGALDLSARAVNTFTFRVTCANGEVFDRTFVFSAIDDRSQTFGKDPDDQRFYAFDVSGDLALSGGTTIATVQAPTAFGVSALTTPVLQGGQAILKLGGLDTSNGAVNSCNLVMMLGTGEVISRTAYFSRQDH